MRPAAVQTTVPYYVPLNTKCSSLWAAVLNSYKSESLNSTIILLNLKWTAAIDNPDVTNHLPGIFRERFLSQKVASNVQPQFCKGLGI